MARGNSFSITGHVVRDSEQTGNGPVKFSIAWNKARKVGDEWETTPHYFDAICWDRDVKLRKGEKAKLEGYISQERWSDDKGNKRSKVVLVAYEIVVVPKKTDTPSENAEAAPEEIPF